MPLASLAVLRRRTFLFNVALFNFELFQNSVADEEQHVVSALLGNEGISISHQDHIDFYFIGYGSTMFWNLVC